MTVRSTVRSVRFRHAFRLVGIDDAQPAGDYDVAIEAGGTAVSTTPATDAVPVAAGQSTIAYAWGTADDLQIAVQTVKLRRLTEPTFRRRP